MEGKSTGHPAAHALARYRCFLPDLAGLAGLRRAGPGNFNFNNFAFAWVFDTTNDSGLKNPGTKEMHERSGANRAHRRRADKPNPLPVSVSGLERSDEWL